MNHTIVVLPAAIRDLKKLNNATRKKIAARIDRLTIEPLPVGVRKLKGTENYYRIRVGNYRILYEIDKTVALVKIFRVRDRKSAYGNL